MRALCWHGANDVRVETVPDPTILNPGDAILKVTSTALCGSDLHIYGGYIPTVMPGDIIGHEFMGEVVEVGSGVKSLRVGDRVVVPSMIVCGGCYYCQQGMSSLCDNSNHKGWMEEKLFGNITSAIYGYSHAFGGYAGSDAEYIRVPYADAGALKVPPGIPDENLLMISDAIPTGYMGAELCDIQPGDTVAVWGCGAVGQFAMVSAYLMGAAKVIGIDRFPARLKMAQEFAKAEVINYEEVNAGEALKQMTGGRGPDCCIDAVGLEAHGIGVEDMMDQTKQKLHLETDRPYVLREMMLACRKGGTLSIMGVYGGVVDKIPLGAAFNKGLTFRMGQMHGQKYMHKLLDLILEGAFDPARVISHTLSLEDGPSAFRMFQQKEDDCVKIILKPGMSPQPVAVNETTATITAPATESHPVTPGV